MGNDATHNMQEKKLENDRFLTNTRWTVHSSRKSRKKCQKSLTSTNRDFPDKFMAGCINFIIFKEPVNSCV